MDCSSSVRSGDSHIPGNYVLFWGGIWEKKIRICFGKGLCCFGMGFWGIFGIWGWICGLQWLCGIRDCHIPGNSHILWINQSQNPAGNEGNDAGKSGFWGDTFPSSLCPLSVARVMSHHLGSLSTRKFGIKGPRGGFWEVLHSPKRERENNPPKNIWDSISILSLFPPKKPHLSPGVDRG